MAESQQSSTTTRGPLAGLTVIELAGIGPGPFCGMMLSDMGADVIRIDRPRAPDAGVDRTSFDFLARGRRSIAVDLKQSEGREVVLQLVESADVIFEGFRPGVTERLGLGPEDCLARNPKIVYGRMTGWGQDGPYASAAGHDINYIALAGVLEAIGHAGEAPVPPLNLVGDFGGGGMYLAFGIMCAVFESQASGVGQVVDAAMVDGAASLINMVWGMRASGVWQDERGTNVLDSGSHFYQVFETSDGGYVSIASAEPQFYAELLRLTELEDDEQFLRQHARSEWPQMKARLAELFKTKTRDEWCVIMEHTDVCFAPVLSLPEATEHPHNKERGTFVEIGGHMQSGPAPRFSRTQPPTPQPPVIPGHDTSTILADLGFDAQQIAQLRAAGTVG